jgi:hypothetical protein
MVDFKKLTRIGNRKAEQIQPILSCYKKHKIYQGFSVKLQNDNKVVVYEILIVDDKKNTWCYVNRWFYDDVIGANCSYIFASPNFHDITKTKEEAILIAKALVKKRTKTVVPELIIE